MERYYYEKPIGIPEGLNPEEEKVWNEMLDFEDSLDADFRNHRISNEVSQKISVEKSNFGKELRKEKINPEKYLLWHKFIGSTVELGSGLRFDTKDHRIEKFMRKFYAKYTK